MLFQLVLDCLQPSIFSNFYFIVKQKTWLDEGGGGWLFLLCMYIGGAVNSLTCPCNMFPNVYAFLDRLMMTVHACCNVWMWKLIQINWVLIKKMCSPGCSDNPQDDPASMDFVTSAANIRAHLFSITMKSRFDVKGL